MSSFLRYGAAALAMTALFAACSSDDDTSAPETTAAAETTEAPTTTEAAGANIVETAVAAGSFDTLVAAVQAAGLVDTLSGDGPFTVFAPTDDAFAALPEGLLELLLEDTATLSEILTYHVVAGEVLAADVVSLTEATSVQGDTIDITVDGASVMVDAANVVTTDITTSNGVIHVIDAVILPEGIELPSTGPGTIADIAAEAGTFTTLLAAAEATGLADALANPSTNFTVFAPTDDAFAALPEGALDGLLADEDALLAVLSGHIDVGTVPAADLVGVEQLEMLSGDIWSITVDGDTAMIGNATITATDIEAENGIIHVIDAVILEDTSPGTIVDVATEAGTFTTLLAAADAAGLLAPLMAEGSFTVFAPTDEAFAALPEGTVEGLLADTEALTAVLTTHVIVGAVPAADVIAAESLTMLSTLELPIVVDGDTVTIGGATIIAADVAASNGVIHVIDTVIIP